LIHIPHSEGITELKFLHSEQLNADIIKLTVPEHVSSLPPIVTPATVRSQVSSTPFQPHNQPLLSPSSRYSPSPVLQVNVFKQIVSP